MKTLFINHNVERCGVADYGRRVYQILHQFIDIDISDTEQEGYDTILYNYHYATTPVKKMEARQVALFHEAHLNFEFDKVLNVSDLPRPLFNGFDPPVNINPVPVIGSFGFGFPDKDYPRICRMVKEQFSEAIIKLNIPFAKYGDDEGSSARVEVEKCKAILEGTNIKLETCHQYWSQLHMLFWLAKNDINLFLYQPSHGRGISSTIDYALSAMRPIGVSNSEMFRHLPKEICVDNISIPELIEKGTGPLKQVYEDNSNEKLVDKIKEFLA